jgi:hypothetical protein
MGYDQALTQPLGGFIAELGDTLKIMAGVDVQEWERQLLRPEGLQRQMQQNRAILAAREQESRVLALGGGLAQDENGLRFEAVKVEETAKKGHAIDSLLGLF